MAASSDVGHDTEVVSESDTVNSVDDGILVNLLVLSSDELSFRSCA